MILQVKMDHYKKKEGTKVLSEHKYYVHTHHKDIK